MAKLKDFYGELGVAFDSEAFVIQAAYRAMLKKYHPDVNSSADAAQKTMRIHEAYKVLSDSEKRERYDRALMASRKTGQSAGSRQSEQSFKSPPPPPVEPASPAYDLATSPNPTTATKALLFFGVVVIGFISYAATRPVAADLTADESLEQPMNLDMPSENLVAAQESPTLANTAMPQVNFKIIESAAEKYTQVLFAGGIAAARAFSEKCHTAALAAPTWEAFDRCAAFDYAAAYVDDSLSSELDSTKNAYFQFQTDNMERFYESGGAKPLSLFSRLADLKKYAGQAAQQAVESEISERAVKEERARAKQEADALAAVQNSMNSTASASPSSESGPTYVAPNGEVRRD